MLINLHNKQWVENMHLHWDEYRKSYIDSIDYINKYEPSEDKDKMYEYGLSLEKLYRYNDALTFYNSQLENYPEDETLNFRKGIMLLSYANDKAGIDHIKFAMERNNMFTKTGLEVLGEFLQENGMKGKKEELKDFALKMADEYNKKEEELELLKVTDNFVEANISEEMYSQIKEKLNNLKFIKRAFLVTKKLNYSEGEFLVLAVITKSNNVNGDALVQILKDTQLPYFLLHLNTNVAFTKLLKKIKNSEILNR